MKLRHVCEGARPFCATMYLATVVSATACPSSAISLAQDDVFESEPRAVCAERAHHSEQH